MNRHDLAVRQQDVLQALLQGEVPDGFDPRSAAMTTRVLLAKRRSEAVDAMPELRTIPDLAARFDAWASRHPRHGCPHDDVLDFLAHDADGLPEPLASVRAVERVYRGHSRFARDRRAGQPAWVVALGGRVWHVGPH